MSQSRTRDEEQRVAPSAVNNDNNHGNYGATLEEGNHSNPRQQQQQRPPRPTNAMSSERLDELLAAPQTTTTTTHRRARSQTLHTLGRRPSYRRHGKRQRANGRHRTTTSLTEFVHDVGVDAREQLHVLRQTLLEELEDYDSGRSPYFMDMSLLRSMSVLPEDLTEFVNESLYLDDIGDEGEEEGEGEPLFEITEVERPPPAGATIPFSAYSMLLVAVLAVSSNGTALHMLYHVPAPLKLYWRMTVTAAVLFFFALKAVAWNKTRPSLNSVTQWGLLGAATVAFAAHTLLIYTALEYTTIGNAIIYGNSQALLLIVGKAVVGEPVTWLEGTGVATAVAGALLCSRDSEGRGADDPGRTAVQARLGDLLALLSAAAGVVYLTLAKAVRPHMSVTVFMFLVMFLGSWMVLLYLRVTDVPITLDRDPVTGLWGWMTATDHHWVLLLWISVVCNVLGTMGFVRAMQYFDTILIAVATLLEPMIASFIAYIFRVGLLPGPLGYLGNALVTLGTIAVVASSAGKGAAGGH